MNFSELWQLTINTGTTIVTFLAGSGFRGPGVDLKYCFVIVTLA